MNKPTMVLTALSLNVSASLAADDLDRATLAFCDKLKSCASESTVADSTAIDQPELMRLMEQTCSNIRQQYRMIAVKPALQKAAANCIESKIRLSCDAINNDTETSECADLYALGEN